MKYYALLDNEDFDYFGDFDSIYEALDNEPMNTVWVFSEGGARALLAKMKEELES